MLDTNWYGVKRYRKIYLNCWQCEMCNDEWVDGVAEYYRGVVVVVVCHINIVITTGGCVRCVYLISFTPFQLILSQENDFIFDLSSVHLLYFDWFSILWGLYLNRFINIDLNWRFNPCSSQCFGNNLYYSEINPRNATRRYVACLPFLATSCVSSEEQRF